MNFNIARFRELIEKHAKPRWEHTFDGWELRHGGGETYIQEILEKARPYLRPEAIRNNPKENLANALSVHVNLLSPFAIMHVKTFFDEKSDKEIAEKFSMLLYGEGSLEERAQEILGWGKLAARTDDPKKKKGIPPIALSYFLAMAAPRKYPFCKPGVYEYTVKEFLGPEEIRKKPVERILHCQEVYLKLLETLEDEFGLKNGNLLDVHSLCWTFSYMEKEPEGEVQYWTYAPGKDANFLDEFYEKGIMAIGWDYLEDLSQYGSKDEMLERLKEIRGGDKTPFNSALACHEFANVIKKGDVIFAKKGLKEIIGYGIVESDYFYDKSREKFRNVRKVKWLDKGSWKTGKDQLAMKTLTNISAYPDFVDKLKKLVDFDANGEGANGEPPGEPKFTKSGYNIQKEIETVFMADQTFTQVLDLLRNKKNIILQGPPGVGKTFIARHLAYAIMEVRDDNRIGMVQFHQSYAYEDFIQGYRPDEDGKFFLKNGIFYDFAKKAEKDPENEYFFIIDEINRGNLSKILGELMVLIEPDKRGTYSLPLTYSKTNDEKFTVPPNLHLIGTMNTADRSLALVDYALRRRFCFVDLEPAFDTPKFNRFLASLNVPETLIHRINRKLKTINDEISGDNKNLGRGFRIGHSYFCTGRKGDKYDEAWYQRIVDFEIAPLLREYWFDNPEKAEDHIKTLKD